MAKLTPFTPRARSRWIRRSSTTPGDSSKNRPFRPPNQPQHGSTRRRRNQPPECLSSPSRSAGRPVPFLRHHCVTRIDSLHRQLLYALWAGSTAIRHVTLCGKQARQPFGPWAASGLAQRQTCHQSEKPLNQHQTTELKFQTRLYQSR
jgi:hypothetical protein